MTEDQEEQEEQQLRILLMTSQIERLRQEISNEPRARELQERQIERLRQELKHDQRKFIIELIVGAAAFIGVGIAIARLFLFHS